MRDLSLHILDLMENSIRADASEIQVTVLEDAGADRLEIAVEDNGTGLNIPDDQATNPFFTTKEGKKTGLGLSLFKATVERAGGQLTLAKSALGGLAVRGVMQLSHVDRIPLGDMAATFSSVVCTNPHIDLCGKFRVGDRELLVRVSEIIKGLPAAERYGLAVARIVFEKIKDGLATIEVTA